MPFRSRTLSRALVLSFAALVPAPAALAHSQAPVPATADDLAIPCPLTENHEDFTDTWGAPRSGGRRHEGVDLIADYGTPIVAVADGSAHFKRNRLGGNAVWLTSTTGDRFYYAHLDRFEGDSRDVVEGEVIGYVGSTGNAKGPHLHFEVHPGGSVTNPYPFVADACFEPPVAAGLPVGLDLRPTGRRRMASTAPPVPVWVEQLAGDLAGVGTAI